MKTDEKLTIVHRERVDGGEYRLSSGDSDVGYLTYAKADNATVVAQHTVVHNDWRGQGMASHLVNRLITDARDKRRKIVPACSYVRTQFKRNPEWQDLLADEPQS